MTFPAEQNQANVRSVVRTSETYAEYMDSYIVPRNTFTKFRVELLDKDDGMDTQYFDGSANKAGNGDDSVISQHEFVIFF